MKGIILPTEQAGARAVAEGREPVFLLLGGGLMKSVILTTAQVRGILDGRVTMFREPLKPQPWLESGARVQELPYQPGDILYVREAWAREECTPDCAGRENEDECPFKRVGESCYRYKAQYGGAITDIAWRSPATMPREAARIFLRVMDVRVERVQEITGRDCQREGILLRRPFTTQELRECYKYDIWDRRYAKRDLGYDENPWTVAVVFERVKEV